jgi:hypothetical protein
MRNYLVLMFIVLFAYTNKTNAINTVVNFDNKETFPVQVDFSNSRLGKKTKITIPARTTKTIVADHASTMKISAEQGSKMKLDLSTIQEGHPVFVTLNQEALKVLDGNLACINIKPFRPLE